MDLNFSDEDLTFQKEVQQFLKDELPDHIKEAKQRQTRVFLDKDIALEWQAILAKKGWAVPSWPQELGGPGWSASQKYIFSMECYKAGTPLLIPLGLLMLAPVLIVSIPNSSQRCDAASTTPGSDTPHNGPKANRFSYSIRTPPSAPDNGKMCSQPIVHAAQLVRVRSRSASSDSGDNIWA